MHPEDISNLVRPPLHPQHDIEVFPQNQADRCVMCGLCLPFCPTYLKAGDENESPRGRIALMRAMARGELPINAKLQSHLDSCLACRSCEKACPSMVAYGTLIEAGRALLAAGRRRKTLSRLFTAIALDWLIARQRNLRALARLLRLYQRSGLQRLMRASGVLGLLRLSRLEAVLPPLAAQERWQKAYPAFGKTRARVLLFTGCVGSVADRSTLKAAIRVLNLLGFEVHVPPAQTCCGALHLHAGRSAQARMLMRENIAAFADGENAGIPIIHAASGCGATLAEYPRHLSAERGIKSFAERLVDINRFVAETAWPAELALAPLAKTIAVHDPCSLRNVLREQQWPYALLRRIPEAQVVGLTANHLCCGGAGAYPITQPRMADELRADKLESIGRLGPDFIVSANVGCALHLRAGLQEKGPALEVTHPITLLERQLRWRESQR